MPTRVLQLFDFALSPYPERSAKCTMGQAVCIEALYLCSEYSTIKFHFARNEALRNISALTSFRASRQSNAELHVFVDVPPRPTWSYKRPNSEQGCGVSRGYADGTQRHTLKRPPLYVDGFCRHVESRFRADEAVRLQRRGAQSGRARPFRLELSQWKILRSVLEMCNDDWRFV